LEQQPHAHASYNAPSKIITAIQLILRKTQKYFLSHRAEVSQFIQCIKEDKQPSPSGEDALKDLEIIEKAYKNQMHLEKD
jgi:predicted dehydrogenase